MLASELQKRALSQTGNNATVTIAGSLDQPTLTRRGGSWLITGGIGF